MKNSFDFKAQFGTEIKYFGHTLGVEGKNQDSNANLLQIYYCTKNVNESIFNKQTQV